MIPRFWLLLGIAASVLAVVAFLLLPAMRVAADNFRRLPRQFAVGFALVALAVAIFGGSKHGEVTVSDDYIADDGSYLTNDVCHIAIKKLSLLLPDSTTILVYARELSSTNAADWFQLSPELTFADHPYDYSLPNATNYNVLVAADYTPAPVVHTNGVWQMRGFEIPGNGFFAFPNTKIKTED